MTGGSLWGHIDEGMFFAGLAVWWLINMFRDYNMDPDNGSHKPRFSYPSSCCRRKLQVEIAVKIFGITGGILIELIDSRGLFYDEGGDFLNVSKLQHISIYVFFMLHVWIDFLQQREILKIRGLDYLTASLSFFWYGTVFIFHSFANDLLEKLIHCVGVLLCFGSAVGFMWEYGATDKFVPNYFRNLMVLTLGTWFIHTPFFLYAPNQFPGGLPNPKWQRESLTNFEFAATMLGVHLLANIGVTIAIHLSVKQCNKGSKLGQKNGKIGEFRLKSTGLSDEENGKLLGSEED